MSWCHLTDRSKEFLQYIEVSLYETNVMSKMEKKQRVNEVMNEDFIRG